MPDWKPLQHAQADVIVDRNFVDAYIVDGFYYGATVEQLLATTRRKNRREEESVPYRLAVNTMLEGKAAQGLDFLQHSPVRANIGRFVDEIALTGEMALDVNLSLLLAEQETDLQLAVAADLQQSSFAMPAQTIDINDNGGGMDFDL